MTDQESPSSSSAPASHAAAAAPQRLQALLGDGLRPRWWQSITLWLAVLVLAAAAGGWWYWQRQRLQGDGEDPARHLNQRPQQWLGQQAILQQDVVNGLSRVRLGDSVWPVRCQQSLSAGSHVRVSAVDGITLIVEPVDHSD